MFIVKELLHSTAICFSLDGKKRKNSNTFTEKPAYACHLMYKKHQPYCAVINHKNHIFNLFEDNIPVNLVGA